MGTLSREALLAVDHVDEREFIQMAVAQTLLPHEITTVYDGQSAIISLSPVVVLTSSDPDQDNIDVYQFGANDIIIKPVELEDFLECVRLIVCYWLMRKHSAPNGKQKFCSRQEFADGYEYSSSQISEQPC